MVVSILSFLNFRISSGSCCLFKHDIFALIKFSCSGLFYVGGLHHFTLLHTPPLLNVATSSLQPDSHKKSETDTFFWSRLSSFCVGIRKARQILCGLYTLEFELTIAVIHVLSHLKNIFHFRPSFLIFFCLILGVLYEMDFLPFHPWLMSETQPTLMSAFSTFISSPTLNA
jgi:hypothetical protein